MKQPTPPQSYEELERYLPYVINRLSTLGQAAQGRMLQENGVNLITLRTLSILQIEDGLTINEIAARTFTEQSSTSRAIDAMVSQGLVERRIPDNDQRRREVNLTDQGRKMLQQSWPAMDRYFAALSEGVTAEEREAFRAVVARMFANLSRLNP